MDPLLKGTALVVFEESPRPEAALQCVPVITAALLSGFRLADTQGGKCGNIEHAYVGDALHHPRKLKDLKAAEVRRMLSFRFQGGARSVVGVEMRVEEFVLFWQQDPALRARFESRADWDKNLAIIDAKIRASEPVVKAGWDGRRTVLVPLRVRADDSGLRKLLVNRYENG
jgi:hypothetical protein